MSFFFSETKFETIPISQIYTKIPEVFNVHSKNTIHETLEKLISFKNVQSLPVYDKEEKTYVGFVEYQDIVYFISKNPKIDFNKTPINEVPGLFDRNPFIPVYKTDKAIKAIELLVKSDVPRIPILHTETDQVISILSQFDLIRYLSKNMDSLSHDQRKMKISNLGQKNVSCANEKTTAIECFQKMNELKIGGLPVVDESNGELIATINASDLKFFEDPKFTTNYNEILQLNVIEFLDKIESRRKIPIFCDENSTLEQIIKILTDNRIHRTFLVNSKKQPIRVISQQDVLRGTLTSMKSRDENDNLTPQIKKLLNSSLKDIIENEIEFNDDSLSFLESELIMDVSEKLNIESFMKKNKIKRRVAVATMVRNRIDLLKNIVKSKNEIFKNLDFVDFWKGYFFLVEVLEAQKMKKMNYPFIVAFYGSEGIGKNNLVEILIEILKMKNYHSVLFDLKEFESSKPTTNEIDTSNASNNNKVDFIFFETSSNNINGLFDKDFKVIDYLVYVYSDYHSLKVEKYNQLKKKVNLDYWEKLWMNSIIPVVNGLISDVPEHSNLLIKKNEKHQILSFN
eukprot:gene2368-2835_t